MASAQSFLEDFGKRKPLNLSDAVELATRLVKIRKDVHKLVIKESHEDYYTLLSLDELTYDIANQMPLVIKEQFRDIDIFALENPEVRSQRLLELSHRMLQGEALYDLAGKRYPGSKQLRAAYRKLFL